MAKPLLAAGLGSLRHQAGVTLGIRRVRPCIGAARVVLLQHAVMAGMLQRQLRGHRLHGFVVGAQHAHAVCADAAPQADPLHGIPRLGGIAAVVTHATAIGRSGVFGLRGAVGEQHQPMAGGGLGVLLQPPAQAFLGQQALDEGGIGFPVLDAVAARTDLGQERPDLVAKLPGRQRRVAGEHGLHDLHHGAVLEHAAVPPLGQQPGPRHQRQPVPGQAAVGSQARGLAHQAAARDQPAVREPGVQCGGLAQPVVDGQRRIGGQQVHRPLEVA